MSRIAGDVPTGFVEMPPKGKYVCTVLNVVAGKSAQKKTPQIEVTFSNGEYEFPDQFYITNKTLGRLCLFAMRVCGMSRTEPLPDDNLEAAKYVANFIMKNAIDKKCVVTIEEREEKYMPATGPDAGRMKSIMRRRVPMNGYEEYKQEQPQGDMQEQAQNLTDTEDQKLPF